MEPDLLNTVSSTLKYRLAEQPQTAAEHLARQLGLSCEEVRKMADNDPSVAPDLYILAAFHLNIDPEFIRAFDDYRHLG